MALPSWLSVAFTIADFVVQRVDRVGPVSFEPPEKQPPEHAAETVAAPDVDTSVDEAPPAEVDRPQSSTIGFRAGGGGEPSSGGDPGNEDDDDDDGDGSAQLARAGGSTEPSSNEEDDDDDDDNGNGSAKLARAGGGNDPTPAPPPEPPDDNGGDQNVVQCSFRAMRPADQHSRYQVEKARDDAGEERPA